MSCVVASLPPLCFCCLGTVICPPWVVYEPSCSIVGDCTPLSSRTDKDLLVTRLPFAGIPLAVDDRCSRSPCLVSIRRTAQEDPKREHPSAIIVRSQHRVAIPSQHLITVQHRGAAAIQSTTRRNNDQKEDQTHLRPRSRSMMPIRIRATSRVATRQLCKGK